MFVRHQAWHAIIALRKHTNSQTTSNMASNFTLGQHTLREEVGVGILSLPLECTHGWTSLGVAMLSFPLGSIHDRTASCIKFHHCPFESKHCQTSSSWHAIIKFRLNTQTDNIGRSMLSSPFCTTYDQSIWGIRCNHCPWIAHAVRRR